MSKDKNAIAIRGDINDIGSNYEYTKYPTPSPDGLPLTRCVPMGDFNGDEYFSVTGDYENNQMVKFEDVIWSYVIPPEPEPDDVSAGTFHKRKHTLVSNTSYPGKWYLAENGTGVLQARYYVVVRDREDIRKYYPTQNSPTEWTYFNDPVDIVSIDEYDTVNFSAWTTNNNTVLNVKPLRNNTGNDEKVLELTLNCHMTVPGLGEVRDTITETIKQVGYVYKKVYTNLTAAYYNEQGYYQPGILHIMADGSGYAKLMCNVETRRSKTDNTAYTVTNRTSTFCKPEYASSETSRWFTIDDETQKITAPNLGNVEQPYHTAYFSGRYYDYNDAGALGWWPVRNNDDTVASVFVSQDGNHVTTTETTTRFVADYVGSYYRSDIQKYYTSDISYTGTTTAEDKHMSGSDDRIIHAGEFDGLRDYTVVIKYSSGYIVSSESFVNQHVVCTTMSVIDGETPSDVEIDTPVLYEPYNTPCLIVGHASSSTPRNIPIMVGYTSSTSDNPTARFTFTQYGWPTGTTQNEITGIWVKPNQYDFPNDSPSTNTYRIPWNYYGRTAQSGIMHPADRLVTATCVYSWTNTEDGVTTSGQGAEYVPIDSGDSYMRVTLTGPQASIDHFVMYKKSDDPVGYQLETPMVYGDFSLDYLIDQDDGKICHYIYVSTLSANTTGQDISVTLEIEYSPYAGAPYEDMQSITIIHEHQ